MNIQTIKIKFIQEFAGLNNEALVKKMYDMLIKEKKMAYETLLIPMTEQKYINKALEANKDISESEITDHNELRNDSKDW